MNVEEIWAEKYRPELLKDLVGQDNIKHRLQEFVNKKSMPHLLFAGPAGIGKTTAALCIANELFGNNWKSNFLELNSSDERGIDTVRTKVKEFARTVPLNGLFKIICLDEADALTKDAQHALRRTMENYSATCRFILACNYSSKIIPPIQSRCAVFRFSTLKEEEMIEAIKNIVKKEGIQIEDDAYKTLFEVSEGDMRKATNILQLTSTEKITKDSIYKAMNMAEPATIRIMLETALKGNFIEVRKKLIEMLYVNGLAGEDIIKEMCAQVYSLDVDDKIKLALIEKIGEYEFRLTEGSNPQVQLEALLAQITMIGVTKQ